MRIKSEVWVQAYLRTCQAAGAFAVLVRRGDADAGAIYIKVCDREFKAWLFGPAVAGFSLSEVENSPAIRLSAHFNGEPRPEAEVDQQLSKLKEFDPDLWIVEVEDPEGRHFLGDWIV